MAEDLSHRGHLDLQKGWRLSSAMWAVNHGAPIKTLDIKAGEHPWIETPHAYCHTSTPGNNTVHDPRKRTGAPHLELPWTPPHAPLPLADFNQYPLTGISCNHECNGFQ